MAIKRLTIELDDSSDRVRPTTVPEGLRVKEATELKQRELTSAPTEKDTVETISPLPGAAIPRAIGRTLADLIAEFLNDSRAMATILLFVSFIIFVPKIQKLDDLVYPIATGIILNVVWFGVSFIRRLRRKQDDAK
jgi:hypothetical protein